MQGCAACGPVSGIGRQDGGDEMKNALITGSNGFAGRHLAELLVSRGWAVTGIDAAAGARAGVETRACDICDREQVAGAVRGLAPDAVFHLAGLTVALPGQGAEDFLRINAAGTVNLLEAGRREFPSSRFIVICSSAEYGLVAPEQVPIVEDTPLRPLTAYGLSKVSQDYAAQMFHLLHGMDVVRLRPFNHIGPGQEKPVSMAASFASQIAQIESGSHPPVIKVGNLGSVRDILDVRDVVRGYLAAAERGLKGDVYNIAGGQGSSGQSVLDHLLAMAGRRIAVEIDPARLQPGDVPISIGSTEKFHALTGWKKEIPMEQTLADILNHWRRRKRG